jgi:preprotein translocase subunit SecG
MYTLFVVLISLASLLMIGIVLIQESKGGGLASAFSSSNQIMGVRKTTDFIEKATWGLAIAMVVISVICAYVAPSATTSESVLENSATEQSTTNPNNLPGFGASQTKQAAPAQGGAQQSAPKAPAQPAK